MFFVKLIRYLRGYIQFCAQGVFIERFLNLVARAHIPLWSGHKNGEVYTGYITAANYRKLRSPAKKTGVRLKVVAKTGIPFKRRKYRKRTGLLVGAGLCCLFIAIMSQFIWRVTISGNGSIEESKVVHALEEIGVRPGVLRSSIDVRGCEQRAMLAMEEFSWVALNIEGSTVHVELKESTLPPKMDNPHEPCNVIASASGQIISMNIYDGQPLASIGDAVKQGDIIISGITQDGRGQSLFKQAKAEVIARIEHTITVEVPLEQTEYVESGKTLTRRYLNFFGLELPIFLPQKTPDYYKAERERGNLSLLSTPLPVGYLKESYTIMQPQQVTYTETQAKQLALKELANLQKAQIGEGTILERKATGKMGKDSFTITAYYICTIDIAKQVPIATDKIN